MTELVIVKQAVGFFEGIGVNQIIARYILIQDPADDRADVMDFTFRLKEPSTALNPMGQVVIERDGMRIPVPLTAGDLKGASYLIQLVRDGKVVDSNIIRSS